MIGFGDDLGMSAGAGAGAGGGAHPGSLDMYQLPEDRITLTGLEVFAHHGVFDFEREQGQLFRVDVEIAVDLRGASDELGRTVHYGELADAVRAAVANNPVDLIETVAERVAEVALGFAGVHAAKVTIHKPDAPIDGVFSDVSVTIVRYAGPAESRHRPEEDR